MLDKTLIFQFLDYLAKDIIFLNCEFREIIFQHTGIN
jgi:hypothetical protein